ncbi:type 1 periplasmic binding fold superfamily protein [Flavobacteriaceae bacterium]|nr:type 1 periplasmic binding fold superfamily protein [Flavobacteriaceae bacterium]
MKTSAFYALLTLAMLGCSDDDTTPEVINDEELITTVILTLTQESGDQVVLTTVDLDGDGPDEPVTTVVGNFSENTIYDGTVAFLDESGEEVEDITQEVIEEADEHQVFYTTSEGLNITTTYQDFDSNDNPLGVNITLETGEASSGSLTVTLRHEPVKPNDGLDSAGGETDIATSFDVTIE